MKKISYKKISEFLPYLFLLTGALAVIFLVTTTSPDGISDEIISRQGIHWHSRLLIKINGVSQSIPSNVGLETDIHNPIHTHDEDAKDGVLHMEFSGLVTKDSLRLKNFFSVWKKQFSELCIMDNCSEVPGKVIMKVNGKTDDSFGEYSMKDGDLIEIDFTK